MKNLPIALAFALLLTACGKEGADQTAADAPAESRRAGRPAGDARAADERGRPHRGQARHGSSPAAGARTANKARDQYRHPKETLTFFGVKAGRDAYRDHAGRRLVRRDPGAADERQRHLHRRGRQAEESGRRGRARQQRDSRRNSPTTKPNTAKPRSSNSTARRRTSARRVRPMSWSRSATCTTGLPAAPRRRCSRRSTTC